MLVTKVYNIGAVSFTLHEGDEKTILKFGRRDVALYTSDVMDFCRAFLGVGQSVSALAAPTEPLARREKVLADYDNRTAVSSTPIRSITRDELARMERPVTPVPGVTFGGAFDMPVPAGLSFKK